MGPACRTVSHQSAQLVSARCGIPGGSSQSLDRLSTLRLRGGRGGRRRKCAGLRKGGFQRKKDSYLRRVRDQRRDQERQQLRGIRKAVASAGDSDNDVPADLDLQSVSSGGVAKYKVQKKETSSPQDEVRFQKAWAAHSGDGDGQLRVAIKFRRLREARRLLDAGEASPDAIMDAAQRRTILHQVVLDNDVAAAELLCRKGADLYALDSKFLNPTKLSMRRGHVEMFSLLQSWGGVANPQKTHLSRR